MSSTNERAGDGPLLAGRYELGEPLGSGGMSHVYRATDQLLHRLVAVKVLREAAGDASDRARFVAEARTLARLSHPGLVTLLDAGFGTADGSDGPPSGTPTERPFLVMELVDGITLCVAISRGALDPEAVATIGAQVAETLAYVHARDVVHRDVKPGNVLLDTERRAKLADFGIARLLGDDAGHTRTGQTIGTAAYLSPEQIRGETVSGATDVYSLGLVLLEALTGRREYQGPAMEAAIARLSRRPQVPDDLPDLWLRLLPAMTADKPADRPTAAEVADRLRGTATGTAQTTATAPFSEAGSTRMLTTAVPQATPDAASGPTAGERLGRGLPVRAAVLATAALAVLVAAVVVLALTRDTGTAPAIPSNTPSELRGPLEDLHRAVHEGEG